jgi:cysteine desulfurase/selenocysteine lyase
VPVPVLGRDGRDWTSVHAEFPINEQLIWLNNCGISAMPGPVLAAMERHLRALAAGGVLGVPSEVKVHAAVRAQIARIIGCDADEVVLCHNTNEAMLFVSHGLTLAAGDRVLLLEDEYPSNVYPWQHWQQQGVALDFAPLGRTPDEFLAGFEAQLTPRTRVVSLSAVHWCTGMPLPLPAVGRICAARGIDFVVDGAQGVGMVPLDVRAAGISAMGFSAWKWLLGPIGAGAFYVRRDVLPRLRFPWKGTGSVVNDDVHLPHRDTLKPGMDRYVLSTPNYNDWVNFEASLRYLLGLGMDAVRARIHGLAEYTARGLRAAGFQLTCDAFPTTPTGIIAAAKPGYDSAGLVEGLRARGIVAAERLGRVRLAPHVYLLEPQLDAVVAALTELTSGN